jgi:hypothetical protein
MKITPLHLNQLMHTVKPLDTPELRAKYIANDFPRSELTKNKDMRYRWDLLWMSGVWAREWTREVYNYANDTHVDTALRSIVPPLEK